MLDSRHLVTVWFLADTIVALLPPLYWSASGYSPTILGVPLSMAYFLAIGTFISASVVFAFITERHAGNLN